MSFDDRFKALLTREPNSIERGVYDFTAPIADEGQTQVAGAFGYKWQRSPDWGLGSELAGRTMTNWMMDVLGFGRASAYMSYLGNFNVIVDAGCGNGRETIRMAQMNPKALVIGLDISEGIYVAAENAKDLKNVRFIRADLNAPPIEPGSVDYVFSFGVLHHTPNTEKAFRSVASLLSPNGEISFYVYRKKAPLREYADDHIREAISNMSPERMWQEMEGITVLGRELSKLKANITIPEIPTLGMDAGTHDIQRLIYYTMFKCYWNDKFTFDENVHVNYDWYAPKFAWRHTEDEVRGWIESAGLKETFLNTIPAGFAFRASNAKGSFLTENSFPSQQSSLLKAPE